MMIIIIMIIGTLLIVITIITILLYIINNNNINNNNNNIVNNNYYQGGLSRVAGDMHGSVGLPDISFQNVHERLSIVSVWTALTHKIKWCTRSSLCLRQ